MSFGHGVNRRIVLAAYPRGLPIAGDFRLDTQPVPEPAEGQVLLRTLVLSLDPYMRNLMAEIGPGYAPPVPLGGTMVGSTVSRVLASRHASFAPGELVLAQAGWQDYALSDGNDLQALGDMAQPSLALGGLGMPGFTAHVGLQDIGQPRPGDTVVVAAATGAVGAVVGQLARLQGARVVGIAGGTDKCRHAVNEAGPPPSPDRLPGLVATLLQKRVRMQGFIVLDHYGERFDRFRREMAPWVAQGRIRLHEDVVDGLEKAPAAFLGLLQGRHLGKLVVKVSD